MNEVIRSFPIDCAVLAQFDKGEFPKELLARLPVGLFTVGGKPLIHHWLDRLVNAGTKNIVIVSSALPHLLRQYVGRGERWGFDSVEYISTATLTDWAQVKSLAPKVDGRTCAYISLGSLPTATLSRMQHGSDLWIDGCVSLTSLTAPLSVQNMAELWYANMWCIANQTEIHPSAKVDTQVRREGNYVIGARSVLRGQSQLRSSVVGKDVDIGSNVEIRHSLILDNTTLGSHLKLDRVIVGGDWIYDLKTNQIFSPNDRLLCHRNDLNLSVPTLDRFLATVVLSVTWPLWLLNKSKPDLIRIAGGSDHLGVPVTRTLYASRLCTNNSFAARIPWLVHVIRGELPLFGIRETDEATNSIDQVPAVVSLADFSKGDIDIQNSFQINTHTVFDNLKLLGRWVQQVFSRSQSHATN